MTARNPVEKYLAEVNQQLAAELSFLDAPDKVAEIVVTALLRSSADYRASIRDAAIIETARFIGHSVGKARTTARIQGWRTAEAAKAFNQCRKYDRAIVRRMNEGRDPFAPLQSWEASTPPTEGNPG